MMAALATTAMTIGELLGSAPGDVGGIRINDLVSDSREVHPGAAFVALAGERSHGLDYLEEAVQRGAAVVLFDSEQGAGAPDASSGSKRPAPSAPDIDEAGIPSLAVPGLSGRLGELARQFYRLAEQGPRLVGVTGTNGKSTVAYLVAQAQTLRGHPCAYMGTVGAGIPPALEPQALTTPDCLSLHRTLASLEAGFAAMEVSSHALAQDRIAGLTFETAVFTNLTRDHLDYHADLAQYRAAKARLFQLEGLRRAVIFVDDPFGAQLLAGLPESVEGIDVSLRSDGRLRGTVIDAGLRGITVKVSGDLVESGPVERGRWVITSPLLGDFNAENLLLALGVLLSWNTPVDEACEALSRCQAPPGRMEVLGGEPAQPTVVVDYAHTPAGLERVLESLRTLAVAELWCVFGCGGERDRGKRALMGSAAARFADHIVLTDDNPRGEDPGEIVAEIRAAIIDHPDVWVEHDRARAIREAVLQANVGDVVLVAGKGHEAWQWVAGERRPFSDRAVVEAALGGQA